MHHELHEHGGPLLTHPLSLYRDSQSFRDHHSSIDRGVLVAAGESSFSDNIEGPPKVSIMGVL